VNQIDKKRQRGLDNGALRWTIPLIVAVGLPASIAEDPRLWYVGVVIAAVLLIGYVQIIRIEKEREDMHAGRQTARRAKAIKKTRDEMDRHGADRSSPPED
jgi:hypothetical protein